MSDFQNDASPFAADFFAKIRFDSADGPGVSRQGYGPHENFVHEQVMEIGRQLGMRSQVDSAGNLWMTRPGKNPDLPAFVSGSHGDSVPQGGNYDGLAGVCAALTVAVMLEREKIQLERDYTVLVTRMEESSWFGRAYVGSLALTGQLLPSELQLKHRTSGVTLFDTIKQCGFDPEAMLSGRHLQDLSRIAAFVELHIEQGPRLTASPDRRVAVVTGIRGNIRHKCCRVIGETAHSGAVDRAFRHDAVMALARLLTAMDTHWKEWLEQGEDLVFTAGVVNTLPTAAIAIIAGEVSFSLDIRSLSMSTINRFHALMLDESRALEQELGVRFEWDEPMLCGASSVDDQIRGKIEAAAAAHQIRIQSMPSGAGHDAAVLSNAGVPVGMIFVANQNGSHNAREAMLLDDFMLGCELLWHTVCDFDAPQNAG